MACAVVGEDAVGGADAAGDAGIGADPAGGAGAAIVSKADKAAITGPASSRQCRGRSRGGVLIRGTVQSSRGVDKGQFVGEVPRDADTFSSSQRLV